MDIAKLIEAEDIIHRFSDSDDILCEIHDLVIRWPFKATDNFEEMKHDIINLIKKLKILFDEQGCDTKIDYALHCIVFNKINDNILNVIKEMSLEEDLALFNKSKNLSKMNISMSQLGSKEDYAISFPASVVELSIIGEYNSPLEKLNCLCTSFDLLYAELKTVLVSMISKYSEKENDIPIINSDEIFPALIMVIIKSKPMYFFSNLRYIKMFIPDLSNDLDKRTILNSFDKAAAKLNDLDEEIILKANCDKLETSLDPVEYIKFQSQVENSCEQPTSYLNERRKEYNQQIQKSLSENLI